MLGLRLCQDDFFPSKATLEAKVMSLKAITGYVVSFICELVQVREAAQQFTLVARGLEGSNFGYSSMTV